MSRIGVFGQISEITDHLFLSGAGCLKPEKIKQKRITFVVNATTDEPNTYIQGQSGRHYGIDFSNLNLKQILRAASKF
ncbi:unnamed protein product [Heligmosomoides polygyrus]|uniref:PGA_cap domain-containing protein n=1 Tax=Heligmosomoides polygyrus TaxID=6339 RepID=A0A183F3W9_HELPZ|nr:unnamed protein product [Heligmosomoides polygyrus]